jgi:WD40 repeat protein
MWCSRDGKLSVSQTQIEQLAAATAEAAKEAAGKAAAKTPPKQSFSGHKDEGYAVDWSPVTSGRLLSGDCAGVVHLWEPGNGKWAVGGTSFVASAGSGFSDNPSVEDLQWSPTEATVFASASVDQTVRIWDTRQPGAAALTVHAHHSDVNVISWSRLTTSMLASGADDGSFKIWDLRNFKLGANVAGFTYHKQPVTSIEWSPFESPMLAVGAADNQVRSSSKDTRPTAQPCVSSIPQAHPLDGFPSVCTEAPLSSEPSFETLSEFTRQQCKGFQRGHCAHNDRGCLYVNHHNEALQGRRSNAANYTVELPHFRSKQ